MDEEHHQNAMLLTLKQVRILLLTRSLPDQSTLQCSLQMTVITMLLNDSRFGGGDRAPGVMLGPYIVSLQRFPSELMDFLRDVCSKFDDGGCSTAAPAWAGISSFCWPDDCS